MARSRSLGLLGKSTTKTKNGVLPTKDVWRGIHFTKDVTGPAETQAEHLERVINRENTPFVANSNAISARFGPVKDKFVEKYEPLLRETARKSHLAQLAKRSREYLIG